MIRLCRIGRCTLDTCKTSRDRESINCLVFVTKLHKFEGRSTLSEQDQFRKLLRRLHAVITRQNDYQTLVVKLYDSSSRQRMVFVTERSIRENHYLLTHQPQPVTTAHNPSADSWLEQTTNICRNWSKAAVGGRESWWFMSDLGLKISTKTTAQTHSSLIGMFCDDVTRATFAAMSSCFRFRSTCVRASGCGWPDDFSPVSTRPLIARKRVLSGRDSTADRQQNINKKLWKRTRNIQVWMRH